VVVAAQSRRARKKEARTEEILDRAMALVGEGGLGGLTVVRLAADLDLALGGLYRYFSGLSALTAALQRRALADLAEHMQQAATKPGPPLVRLYRILGAFIHMPEALPAQHRLIDELLSAPDPKLADADALAFEPDLAAVLGIVAQALDACAEAKILDAGDATIRTHQLWATLHGLGHMKKRDRLVGPKVRAAKITGATLRDLCTAWGATDAAITEAERALR
jgi:AcrR family transcriptional regulator